MSEIVLNPYLFFKGNAREALDFYKGIFGGEVTITTMGEYPNAGMEITDENRDQVMHGLLEGGAVKLMASDSSQASDKAAKIELSLSGEDAAKLTDFFNGLADGGNVTLPLDKAPWGDTFGMVTDKYNISWMVNITQPKEA